MGEPPSFVSCCTSYTTPEGSRSTSCPPTRLYTNIHILDYVQINNQLDLTAIMYVPLHIVVAEICKDECLHNF
jgi:hypothetical protein